MTHQASIEKPNLEIFDPFLRINYFSKAHPKPLTNHHDFSFSNHSSINQNIQRVTCKPVKFNNCAQLLNLTGLQVTLWIFWLMEL